MKKISTNSIKAIIAISQTEKNEQAMLDFLNKNQSFGFTAKELAKKFFKRKLSFTEQVLATLEREGKVVSQIDESLGQTVYLIA